MPLNPDLENYKLPTLADIPQIDVAWIGAPDTTANHLGVKGAGEPPIIPTAASIANAVADALGTRLYISPPDPRPRPGRLARRAVGGGVRGWGLGVGDAKRET